MPELELEEAKSLFLSHAHMEKNEVDQVLLEKCVKRCCFRKGQSSSSAGDGMHYHPLALKVLGSGVGDLIRQHDVARQAELITRISSFNLSRQKEHPVFSILRSSFDSLLEEDQLLFLHAALFFPYVHSLNFTPMNWLGMVDGRKGNDIKWRLECLRRRSLLESFGEDGDEFRMHDLWREFAAAEIVDGKWKDRCFLYNSAECNGKVDLTRFQTMRVVKLKNVTNDVALDVRGLKQLRSLDVCGLKLLKGSVVEVNGLGTLEDLTYLGCWGVASNACIAELGWLRNLQFVELVGFRGDKLPDMGKLTNLRILNLQRCRFLQRIQVQNLTNLTRLFVWGCTSLLSVGTSGCRSITRISFLGLFRCTLEEVNVSSCPLLRKLDGICNLTKLRKLDITGCSSIEEFDKLRRLVELEELRAMHCNSLTRLPSCRLPKLRVLDIEPWKVPAGFQWGLGPKRITRFKERNANHRV